MNLKNLNKLKYKLKFYIFPNRSRKLDKPNKVDIEMNPVDHPKLVLSLKHCILDQYISNNYINYEFAIIIMKDGKVLGTNNLEIAPMKSW